MSLEEARKHLRYRRGWRSLLNNLEARELLSGQRFVLRKRGKAGRTTYTVTLAAIAQHAPDLLPPLLRTKLGASQAAATDVSEVKRVRDALHLLDERIEETCVEIIERRVERRLSAVEGAFRRGKRAARQVAT